MQLLSSYTFFFWTLSHPKIGRDENLSSCTKNGVFFSAANCKEGTIFGAVRRFKDPSFFVRALDVDSPAHCIFFILIQSVDNKTTKDFVMEKSA